MIRVNSITKPVANVEKEIVWYVSGFDLDYIKANAISSELQEQYSLMKPNGQVRVRAVDRQEFIYTAKAWVKGKEGKLESEHPVDEASFEIFKYIADSGLVKRRYVILVDEQPMEIDVFFVNHVADGEIAKWAKIDFEYSGNLEKLPEIPFSCDEVILDDPANRTAEQSAVIEALYSKFFVHVP